MENQKPVKRRERLVLPFEKKSSDVGSWTYDHKVGLLVTVIVYMIIGIVFIGSKIIIGGESMSNVMYIDLQQMPEPPQKELTPEEKRQIEQEFSRVQNLISNENAKLEESGSKDDRGIKNRELSAEEKSVNDKMRASKEMYERGLREEQALIDARNAASQKKGNNEKREDVKVKGKVTVSFSLQGRQAVYLHIPAYQCEGGGQVVVSISVNRNGAVTSASVMKSQSTSDYCMTEMAISAARSSQFNVSSSAPSSQNGTITYIFIPQ